MTRTSKRYVLAVSGDGDVTVLTMWPPWYLKPVLKDDLLDQTLDVLGLPGFGYCEYERTVVFSSHAQSHVHFSCKYEVHKEVFSKTNLSFSSFLNEYSI